MKAAVAGKGAAGQVSWAQGAATNLDAVYKQSQTVVNSLKRYTKGDRFKKASRTPPANRRCWPSSARA